MPRRNHLDVDLFARLTARARAARAGAARLRVLGVGAAHATADVTAVRTAAALAVTALLVVALAACRDAASPGNVLAPGDWGSDAADLDVTSGSATVRIFNSGVCYGQYGEIGSQIPNGTFDLPGTFTQLTNFPPGFVNYSARFTGTVEQNVLTLTITVDAIQQTIGPLDMVRGVTHTGGACAYP